MSQCATCGVLCEAFPVTGLESLMVYQGLGCTVIVGDLFITNLPGSVGAGLLRATFSRVRQIRGTLYIVNNAQLPSSNVFSSLTTVDSIRLHNNPALYDARIPTLKQITTNSVSIVFGCDRLCHARYPSTQIIVDQGGCANNTLKYFVHVDGYITTEDFPTLNGLFNRASFNLTNGVVSLLCPSPFCLCSLLLSLVRGKL